MHFAISDDDVGQAMVADSTLYLGLEFVDCVPYSKTFSPCTFDFPLSLKAKLQFSITKLKGLERKKDRKKERDKEKEREKEERKKKREREEITIQNW